MGATVVFFLVVTILRVGGGWFPSVVLPQFRPVPPDDPAESSDRHDGAPGDPATD